jgi:hypothetical protein
MMRSAQSHPKFSSDSARGLYDARGMDEKAIRRAALITLRRAICERFPPRVGARILARLGGAHTGRTAGWYCMDAHADHPHVRRFVQQST